STFMLASDGLYEHVDAATVLAIVAQHGDDLDAAAAALLQRALANGSDDNLSVQLVRVRSLADADLRPVAQALEQLPLPPALQPGDQLDGWRILRTLHTGSRSHVHLAEDPLTAQRVVIKVPSLEMAED